VVLPGKWTLDAVAGLG